jgi:16S rRNA (uracil1498-N3)-methyltransferase
MQSHDTHIFAFFYHHLGDELKKKSEIISIQDKDILHRIIHVLKLQHGDACIVFDTTMHVTGTIYSVSKKEIQLLRKTISENVPLTPYISLYLPILKRTHLEEAVYLATECGVSEIRLTITKKSQQRLSNHEIVRLEKISISACEQAKYFTIPHICEPKPIAEIIALPQQDSCTRIYFDPSGSNLLQTISNLPTMQQKIFECIIGPEGGFTQDEMTLLYQNQFTPCVLTPTILRAKTAVSISIALLRSLKFRSLK